MATIKFPWKITVTVIHKSIAAFRILINLLSEKLIIAHSCVANHLMNIKVENLSEKKKTFLYTSLED
jgi:hypothetical protein